MNGWTSEAAALPTIAQDVLLLYPIRDGEFFKVDVARILVSHEGVYPRPVTPGSRLPTDYWWSIGEISARRHHLVSGSCWWTSLTSIKLPDHVQHLHIQGYDCIVPAVGNAPGTPSGKPVENRLPPGE